MGRQYIDKSELVKEIEKRIKKLKDLHFDTVTGYAGEISGLERLLSLLNTLETEEVVAEQEGICNGILNTIIGDTTWHLKIPLDKVGLKHGDKVKIFITKEK